MTEQEQQMIRDLTDSQSKMLEMVRELRAENAEIKAQLADKSSEKKKPTGQATEAEVDEVFQNLRV